MQNATINLSTDLTLDSQGMRLDQALAKCFPEHSRSRITQWIKSGHVLIDGLTSEPKAKVKGHEHITVQAPLIDRHEDAAEDLPLNIIFEDEHLMIINKPAGLVVHPAAGNYQGTLLNALLHHDANLRVLPRCGIVHRLDKDTTGIMVVAKTLAAHTALVNALQLRQIERKYLALIGAELISGGTVDAPIGRHAHKRVKMAVTTSGKPARTHYRCKTRFEGFTLLDVTLETGRTHQIRVHLSHIGHAIVGDTIYGWRYRVPPKSSEKLQQHVRDFNRQALHAYSLKLTHPITQEAMAWTAPIPQDFKSLLELCSPKGY